MPEGGGPVGRSVPLGGAGRSDSWRRALPLAALDGAEGAPEGGGPVGLPVPDGRGLNSRLVPSVSVRDLEYTHGGVPEGGGPVGRSVPLGGGGRLDAFARRARRLAARDGAGGAPEGGGPVGLAPEGSPDGGGPDLGRISTSLTISG